ncbi:uncharacterized protein LOC144988492 [Oryzias latipes]
MWQAPVYGDRGRRREVPNSGSMHTPEAGGVADTHDRFKPLLHLGRDHRSGKPDNTTRGAQEPWDHLVMQEPWSLSNSEVTAGAKVFRPQYRWVKDADEGMEDTLTAVAKELRTRPDLETKPLPAGRIFFTDGCCFRSKAGPLQAAAAVVEFSGGKFITLTAQTLTVKPSAQAAEVLALCLALQAASGEQVTVYSDSAYAVSAALLDLAAWKRNSYLTARGEPIAHKDLMQRLDHALQMPSRVAVVKIPGHSKGNSLTTKGNNAADAAAKAAAGYNPTLQMVSVYTPPELLESPTHDDLVTLQSKTSPEQRSYWLQRGAVKTSDGLWVGPYGQPVAPDGPLLQQVLKESHGPAHLGPSVMMTKLCMWWHPRLRDVCHAYVQNCTVCQSYNVRPTLKPLPGTFDPAPWPGAEIVMDFTDMINPVQGKRYLLVIVDSFSGWPEAYPCKKEDSLSVIKALKDVPPADSPGADLADWTHVYVKAYKRKWSEPRLTGPYRVTARTTSAVQLQGRHNKWYHYSMLRPCLSQERGRDAS